MGRVTEGQRREARRRLLDAAAAEFAAHGLLGANINRVSVAAGFAKGTVYNYFRSKEALFAEVVREACELAVARLENLSPESKTEDRLVALVAGDVAWAQEHEPFARVLVRQSLSGDAAVFPVIVAAAAPYMERVVEVLSGGIDRGEVRDDVPLARLASFFMGLGNLALTSHWASGGAWPSFEEIPTLVVDWFMNGVRRHEPRAG